MFHAAWKQYLSIYQGLDIMKESFIFKVILESLSLSVLPSSRNTLFPLIFPLDKTTLEVFFCKGISDLRQTSETVQGC